MKALIGTAAAILLLAGGCAGADHASTSSHTGCKIESKDRTSDAGSRVYTTCGVFNTEDDPYRLHFTSADTYASLQAGRTYDLTTAWWRIPILSMFPNIIDAKEKKQ